MSKVTTVELPTEERDKALTYLSATAGDRRSEAILKYITSNGGAYLGKLARELAERKVASRRSVYQRLLDLEGMGVLKSEFVEFKSLNPGKPPAKVKAWVRLYTISDAHKHWIKKLFGTRERQPNTPKRRRQTQK